MGLTEKNSVRAYVFRFALELGHCSMQSGCLKRATSGSEMARRHFASRIDHGAHTTGECRFVIVPSMNEVPRQVFESDAIGRWACICASCSRPTARPVTRGIFP